MKRETIDSQNPLTLALQEVLEILKEHEERVLDRESHGAEITELERKRVVKGIYVTLLTAFEEMVERLPTGHTPDGKQHWVDWKGIDDLLSLIREAKKEIKQSTLYEQGRRDGIEECVKVIDDYFKGLILIPAPELTKEKIKELFLSQKKDKIYPS